MTKSATKYIPGGATNPKKAPIDDRGIQIPIAVITKELTSKKGLGQLSKNGIFPVRIL